MSGARAYVDQRVGDVDAAAAVADLAADTWGLTRPVLLRHGMNAIFRSGDAVIRVASPSVDASCSIDLALVLAEHDIPVAAPARNDVVESRGLSATAWEHIASSGEPIDWEAVGSIVQRVHGLSPRALPAAVPTPSPVSFPWWNFDRLLGEVGAELDLAARSGIEAVLERRTGWAEWEPADAVVCHGDVHPGNVVMTAEGPIIIDWDLLCVAPCGWDHAPLMTWSERWGGEPGIYEAFAEGAGGSQRGDERSDAFAELRLVAATLMRVRVALADPAARPEADRRLAYWRGDSDAPIWRAQ